jgi:hypothetical protein
VARCDRVSFVGNFRCDRKAEKNGRCKVHNYPQHKNAPKYDPNKEPTRKDETTEALKKPVTVAVGDIPAEPEPKLPMHVDDWLDKIEFGYSRGEMLARVFIEFFRMPAWKKANYAPFLAGFKVLCNYKGEKMRLIGASRMGDVWLTRDWNRDCGYDLRVNVEDCTDFSGTFFGKEIV